ncbi:DUF2474 domain-containing protein [Nguyenibacter vanlangensis]|uniref:DUF2474 domain-containing protein n=1 Tax=Nguyenibacter vanlangensis TaxID=1216886 RepID=A0A7Y7J0Y5_9PROT|nr:DUF2474 domain-containing protein [Nguyenibacter vanlangensis]NVN13516.1 DUF2474 domain-containing protein [Nguyenibacter vanlangensis]
MAIIEIVRGDGSEAPHRWSARVGWFTVIWAGNTALFIATATLLHLLVPK